MFTEVFIVPWYEIPGASLGDGQLHLHRNWAGFRIFCSVTRILLIVAESVISFTVFCSAVPILQHHRIPHHFSDFRNAPWNCLRRRKQWCVLACRCVSWSTRSTSYSSSSSGVLPSPRTLFLTHLTTVSPGKPSIKQMQMKLHICGGSFQTFINLTRARFPLAKV